MVEAEKPRIEALMRRVAETPTEFLAEPRIGNVGEIHVDAVVADLLCRLEFVRWEPQVMKQRFAPDNKGERNRLRGILVVCWLLADPVFRGRGAAIWEWLGQRDDWVTLAGLVESEKWVHDEGRREELVRLALGACGLCPHGETEAEAADRLSTVSTLQRQATLSAARAAEERARLVREEMLRKRQQDAAAKPSRE